MKANRKSMKDLMLVALSKDFTLRQRDLGKDAELKKNGFKFWTESYEVEGVGNLCFLSMSAMMGAMKMETAVLAANEKDMPLFNLDWVLAMGKETQMVELYDDMLEPLSDAAKSAFQAIKDKDADLTDRETDPHWYDDILLPCSYDKTGKGVSDRFNAAAAAYLAEFVSQLKAAPACDKDAKAEKVKTFATTLFTQGGPAVDNVTKLFGTETAERLILSHMYGVK